jgi:methylated-DNA-[protein]-cysteine S-methyltransferase
MRPVSTMQTEQNNQTTQTLYTTMASPIGELLLVGDGETLSGLYMQDGRKPQRIATDWSESAAPFADVKRQLEEYFAGERTTFEVKLAAEGAPFEREVWHALEEIPFGETVSYGEIARRVGQPTAARAVGTANGRNPIAVIVPCHRVIGADGSLTGYGGGLERKRLLLELESRQTCLRMNGMPVSRGSSLRRRSGKELRSVMS